MPDSLKIAPASEQCVPEIQPDCNQLPAASCAATVPVRNDPGAAVGAAGAPAIAAINTVPTAGVGVALPAVRSVVASLPTAPSPAGWSAGTCSRVGRSARPSVAGCAVEGVGAEQHRAVAGHSLGLVDGEGVAVVEPTATYGRRSRTWGYRSAA